MYMRNNKRKYDDFCNNDLYHKNKRAKSNEDISKSYDITLDLKRANSEDVVSNGVDDVNGVVKVSATKTRNFMLKDPIVDWLDMYGNRYDLTSVQDDYKKKILADGQAFELTIMDEIAKKFRDRICTIKTLFMPFEHRYAITRSAIESGVPVICQAGVKNSKNGSFGIPDLLVKHSVLKEILGLDILPTNLESVITEHPDKYCVIDIKHSTLDICKKNGYLQNSLRWMPYKAQVAIYTEALAELQDGYVAKYAYVWGKQNKIGLVHLDESLLFQTHRAIHWYADLVTNGAKWDVWNPDRNELLPNMNNINSEWQEVKRRIAFHQGELTLLWRVSTEERDRLLTAGIKSWRNRRFSPLMLDSGAKDAVYCKALENCLEVNRTAMISHLPKRLNSLPWRSCVDVKSVELFVDFETIHGMIFMIGVGLDDGKGNWLFTHFTAERLDAESELNLMNAWLKFVESYIDDGVTIIHWTDAEPIHHQKALKRCNLIEMYDKMMPQIKWVDLYKFFVDTPIAIHGAFNYSLKTVARALYDNNLISVIWNEDGVQNGYAAMLLVHELESKREKRLMDLPTMQSIIDYNEVDCKVLYCIVYEFLELLV